MVRSPSSTPTGDPSVGGTPNAVEMGSITLVIVGEYGDFNINLEYENYNPYY